MNTHATHTHSHWHPSTTTVVALVLLLLLVAVAVLEMTAGQPSSVGPLLLPNVSAGPMA